MTLLSAHPVDALGSWFHPPLGLGSDRSVRGTLDALNGHPFTQESNQDYVMVPNRYLEKAGRFRIWGENQDNFYCYVQADAADESDPPVFFETCLDLVKDAGYQPSEIVNGDSVSVCPRFTRFVWHMLVSHIVFLLSDGNPVIARGITGAGTVRGGIPMSDLVDAGFVNPLGCKFPAGFTCYVAPDADAVCIDDWGVAFRTSEARTKFMSTLGAYVAREWP